VGRVFLGGNDVTNHPPYKRDVNTVFQSYALFPHLTVEKNVAFGLERKKVSKDEVRKRVSDVLELVQLGHLAKRKPAQLSGGQAQRVALARALVNRPRALLLDEPLGALDLRLRKQLQIELKRIQQDVGITFVHVTHDQEEAMSMADTIAVMNEGRIEQAGSATDLYESPRTEFVANFLGVSNLLPGTVENGGVRLADGAMLQIAPAVLNGRTGSVAVGIRPEKLSIGPGVNTLSGEIVERAYVGVSTQYVVKTSVGQVSVYVQGAGTHAPGEQLQLSFAPEETFVVSRSEDERQ
jgi:spermidine/putrescine transport system ATP-binding protein